MSAPRAVTGPGEASARALSAAGLDPAGVAAVVERALDEDLGGDPGRDVTSEATVPAGQVRTGALVTREDGVACGLLLLPVATEAVARRLGLPAPEVELLVREGCAVRAGNVLAEVTGRTRVLTAAHRAALGLAGHLSGVATATRAWVGAVAGTGAQVRERSTTPGLRALERHAVRCGGGVNPREGLHDAAVVGPEHLLAAGSVRAAHAAVRDAFPELVVQVQVATAEQAFDAVAAGARFLLCTAGGADPLADGTGGGLDDGAVPHLRRLVAAARDAAARLAPGERVEVEVEVALGLGPAAAREVVAGGVDLLCPADLVHGVRPLDLALELDAD